MISISDLVRGRAWLGEGGRTFADGLHANQVIDLIIATSSQHAACYLAIQYGLARAKAGHLSLQKLIKVTQLPSARCTAIIEDMRTIVTRCGGL